MKLGEKSEKYLLPNVPQVYYGFYFDIDMQDVTANENSNGKTKNIDRDGESDNRAFQWRKLFIDI